MNKKINLRLLIVPTSLLITLIYSIVMLCIGSDSQNWYSILGQIVLIMIWIFANLGLKKILKNKELVIILANVIFQFFIFLHILIYLFVTIESSDYILVQFLVYVFFVISFVEILVMIYHLIASIAKINLFKDAINIEYENVKKINKMLLLAIPILLVWFFFYSLIMLAFDMMYVALNFFVIAVLIAIWISMSLVLGKHMKNKKLSIKIAQIIFQVFLWAFIICCIVLTIQMSYLSIAVGVFHCVSLCIISIISLIVLALQLKVQNSKENNI